MIQQDQTIKKRLVKRVIAVGGDTIDIKDGKVYLNGEQLDEPYIREPMIYVPEQSQEYPLTVPEGKLFVMGDNRNFSNDSRDTRYGLVDAENVIGKIVFPKK
jgi:signal peptidase I